MSLFSFFSRFSFTPCYVPWHRVCGTCALARVGVACYKLGQLVFVDRFFVQFLIFVCVPLLHITTVHPHSTSVSYTVHVVYGVWVWCWLLRQDVVLSSESMVWGGGPYLLL